MKQLIIHILDSQILYSINSSIDQFPAPLFHGKINNEKEFISIIKKYNQSHNINQKILSDSITIIINDTYSLEEINYLKDIFKELDYTNINILKESSLLKTDAIEIIIDKYNTRIFNEHYFQISTPLFLKIYEPLIDALINTYPYTHKIKIADIYNQLNNLPIVLCMYYSHPKQLLIDKIK